MLLGSRGSRMRCLHVWTGVTLAAGVILRIAMGTLRTVPADVSALRAVPIDEALTDVAALALAGCAVWLWIVTTLVIATALRGVEPGARSPRGVPAGVRRVVLSACGIALAGGLAAQPSYAEGPRPHVPGAAVVGSLTGLPLPDRALSTAPRARPSPRPVAALTRTVVVQPGDSLWSIAEADLPADSPTSEIAARWQAIYRANRALIGADPDVIAVGQRLQLPGRDAS